MKLYCCALIIYPNSPKFGKSCNCEASHTTDENLNVCKRHKNHTISDNLRIQTVYDDYIQKNKDEIDSYNNDLLSKNQGKIPLKNKEGYIIDFAIVSPEDFDIVMKFSWNKKPDGYAQGSINNKNIYLHQYILGKPKEDHVIDHKDGNKLNNARTNLRFATLKQNTQNKKKKERSTSKYLGVSWYKSSNKWHSQAHKANLGFFSDEVEAAERYDTYALLKYGEHAKTNNLVSYESVKDLDLEEILQNTERELPKHINMNKNRFEVGIRYKNKRFREIVKTLEEATSKLEEFKKEIQILKEKDKDEHFRKPIIRNRKNEAILMINNKNGESEEVPVPEDRWHELTLYKWSKTHNYYQALIHGKYVLLHRYLLNAKKGDIVDHINDNDNTVQNNTIENLRLNSFSGNSHNKIKRKNTTSKYIGVSYKKLRHKWEACINKNGKYYYIGHYSTEQEAALAYNEKAKELYGEFANLNVIED